MTYAVVEVPRTSREYLYVPGIVASKDTSVDVTTLPVSFAFLADGDLPIEDDWQAGSWRPDSTDARILIGPGGGLELAPGWYYVWVMVTGATERPQRAVAMLQVT